MYQTIKAQSAVESHVTTCKIVFVNLKSKNINHQQTSHAVYI